MVSHTVSFFATAFAEWKRYGLTVTLFFMGFCQCLTPVAAKELKITATKTVSKIEHLSARSKLIVENRHGSVQIRCWDREQISVLAHIKGESVDDVAIDLFKIEGGIKIKVNADNSGRLFGLLPPKKVKCDLILSVPRVVLAEIKIIDGLIDIHDIDGYLKCETVNGGIKLLNISGEVEAKTINGPISLTGLTPSTWEAKTNAADHRTGTYTGLQAISENGNILLENVAGSIKVRTVYGQIWAKILDGRGKDINFESISGYIDVELIKPPAELTAETMVGTVDIQVPRSKIISEDINRTVVFMHGRSNTVQNISMKTVSGNITVR